MSARQTRPAGGSIIIMVVGLLVMLGMIGMTFILVSHADRKEASSIANAAMMEPVARGVLERTTAVLSADRFVDGKGTPDPGDDVPYGMATTEAQRIDMDCEDVDPFLASATPTLKAFFFHVTNIHGAPAGDVTEVLLNDARLVDTDGEAWVVPAGVPSSLIKAGTYYGDSLLFPAGVIDRQNRQFFVAVRVVDAGAFLNANLAHYPAAAAAGKEMPVTNISLALPRDWQGIPLFDDAEAAKWVGDSVHNARSSRGATGHDIFDYWNNYALSPLRYGPPASPSPYAPFDMADEYALRWGKDVPLLARGRLFNALGAATFAKVRGFLTTRSSCSGFVMPQYAARPQTVRADLNKDSFPVLFTAFYNLIPPGAPGLSDTDDARRRTAAQLAVNVIDFRDADSNVTLADAAVAGLAGGTKVFGVERQPFLVEAAYKRESVTVDGVPTIKSYYAIELFNPYTTDISLANWKVQVGGAAPVPLGPASIAAGGRVVIVNNSADIKVSGTATLVDTLDLTQTVTILRPRVSGGGSDIDVVIARLEPGDFKVSPAGDPPPDAKKMECIRRDDNRADALYSIALYKSIDGVDITLAGNNLGAANDVTPNDLKGPTGAATQTTPKPAPVYVRNGPFLNVGEITRIYHVGPTDTEALDGRLAKADPYDATAATGRLSMMGGIKSGGWGGGYPDVPLGCLAGEFLMVHSPMHDGLDNDLDGQTDSDDTNGEGTLYGQININAAPVEVLACLPGVSSLPADLREKLAYEIVAYRLGYSNRTSMYGISYTGGGAGYSVPALNRGSSNVTGLRDGLGFASNGELAIPLANRGGGAGLSANKLPRSDYGAVGANYTVAADNSDDGLPTAAGSKVTDDLVKRHLYYIWASNQVTVRSDVFIAYIRVQIGDTTDYQVANEGKPAPIMRRYVAVIDRSNCVNVAATPNVVMFAEIK